MTGADRNMNHVMKSADQEQENGSTGTARRAVSDYELFST